MAIRPAGPIHPRIKDMRLYEVAIRNAYLNPMFARLGRRLAQAESANQAWAAMDDVVEKMAAQPRFGVPTGEIQRQLGRIEGYHRDRVKASFRAALGVDISRLLSEPEIAAFMGRKISENVDLIKTIPARMHQSLKLRLSQELQCVEVLGVNHRVEGFVVSALDLGVGHQPRVDRIAELGDHNQVVDRAVRCLGLGLRVLLPDKFGHSSFVGAANPVYPPQPAVDAVGFCAALPDKFGHSSFVGAANPVYPPQPAVDAVGFCAALRDEVDLVPPAHCPAR